MSEFLIEKALQRALMAYSGKVDRAGKPYILHPLRLMAKVTDLHEQCVALLHDVIEDSDTTADDLRADGFPEEVVLAVVALSREEGETYAEFIERVVLNPLARRIKILDVEDNMILQRLPELTKPDMQLMARYHRAWLRLKSAE